MPGGRPSKYDSKFCEHARKLCLLGATDQNLADFFEVDVSTINNWKIDHPEFFESLKAGKASADADVAASLYHRAMGYSHKAVKMFQYEGCVISEQYDEHYPPDTTACIFWLKNRRPDIWRDRIQHTGDPSEPIGLLNVGENITKEDIIKIIESARGKK